MSDTVTATITEIERRLPGWWWTCGNCRREAHATIGPEVGVEGPADGVEGLAESGDVAGALRDALMRALEWQGGKPDALTPPPPTPLRDARTATSQVEIATRPVARRVIEVGRNKGI